MVARLHGCTAARLEGSKREWMRKGKQLDDDVERGDLCMGVVSMASLQQRILTTSALWDPYIQGIKNAGAL
jgi:hypothetical protein